jgi:hypothetical protein
MPQLIDLLAFAAVFVAIVRIIRTDTDRWAHGTWSKVGWIALTFWLAWSTRFGVLPFGALAAIWQTHRLHRQPRRWNSDGLDVPFAGGIPVPFERRAQEATGAEEES